MAMVAIFIAVSGTGYAVSKLPKNSVKAKQIAKNAVRAAEIKANSVRAPEVAGDAVGAAEIKDGEVGAAEIGDGTIGGPEVGDGAVGTSEVADDSLTGADVNEGSLGQVPDAALLNGLGADAFFRSSNIRYGQADPGGTTRETIHAFPELSAALVTDGDIDNDFVVALRNDRGAGGGNLNIACGKDDLPATMERAMVPPGGVGDILHGGFSNECVVFDSAGGLPSYFVICGWNEDQSATAPAAIRCLALRGGP